MASPTTSNLTGTYPTTRLRRLRHHSKIRDLVRATRLSISDFILPLFIKEGRGIKQPIVSMPGHFQMSLEYLVEEVQLIQQLGIAAVLLFGIPAHKDSDGSGACRSDGVIPEAIRLIKRTVPDLLVITDVCCCEYTSHGHCGIIDPAPQSTVHNDKTLAFLAAQAVMHAQAGADMVAPSGMMDGMVKMIRFGLDQAGYANIPILSYSAKYCSSLYTPFREAAESAPQFGDRQGYQMDPANQAEALREVALDVEEGADILMVKPAGFYLDVIYRIKQAYPQMPLAAYQVSGEFTMIKAAATQGWVNERQVALESLLAIKRAGADIILSYFAKDVALWLRDSNET